jgi:DNA repair protein RadD
VINTPAYDALVEAVGDDPRRPEGARPLDLVLPPSIERRWYQERTISRAYEVMGRGIRRYILHAPVGAGKTILAVIIMLRALAKGQRMLFVADRRELIMQCYAKLVLAGIPKESIGVILGSEPGLRNPNAPIQIASIQSLRGAILPPATLIFLDECHIAVAESFKKLLANYPDAFVIGLTATPCRTDGKPLGDLFHEIVEVASLGELIAARYIVKPFGFSVPKEAEGDMDGVPIKNGDFDPDAAGERMMAKPVMGYIAGHYDRHARGLRGMAFTTHIRQSREVTDVLNGAGIRAVHVDGTTPKLVRNSALDDLKHGRIDILCNCGLFLQGLDMPELKAVIMLRPTQSIVVHVQTAGREMRPWNDIQPILLDHVGNCRRLGHPCDDRKYSLHGRPKRAKGDQADKAKVCKKCYAIADADATECPACGEPFAAPRREIKYVEDIDLVALQEQERQATEKAKKTQFERFWQIAFRDGFDASWVVRRFAERFGDAPPADWTPPERPPITATPAQKRAQYVAWMGVAQRQGLGHAWVVAKYQNKYQEHPDALDAKPADAPAAEAPKTETTDVSATSERVELEF